MAAIDQALDDLLHLPDARRRARFIRRREDAELVVSGGELEFVAVGESPPLFAFSDGTAARVVENLVVDVGHVAHERDGEAAIAEPAPPLVVDECGAQVTDVRGGLHRRAAHVDADLVGDDRHEVDERLGLGVVKPYSHWASLPITVHQGGRHDGDRPLGHDMTTPAVAVPDDESLKSEVRAAQNPRKPEPRRERWMPSLRRSFRPARVRRSESGAPWQACASRLRRGRGPDRGATGREQPRTP